jgi:Tfp pilus assembly protein PilX
MRRGQGFVLFTALIMLLVMTLIGVALVRAVNTGNDVANNIGFLQSTMLSADRGIEQGTKWLQDNRNTLNNDNLQWGYYASDNELVSATKTIDYTGQITPGDASDDVDWSGASGAPNKALVVGADPSGNQVAYIIHRLCVTDNGGGAGGNYSTAAGQDPNGSISCAKMSLASTSSGSKGGVAYGSYNITSKSQTYYRITARALGPRNTATYTQAIVVMEY